MITACCGVGRRCCYGTFLLSELGAIAHLTLYIIESADASFGSSVSLFSSSRIALPAVLPSPRCGSPHPSAPRTRGSAPTFSGPDPAELAGNNLAAGACENSAKETSIAGCQC